MGGRGVGAGKAGGEGRGSAVRKGGGWMGPAVERSTFYKSYTSQRRVIFVECCAKFSTSEVSDLGSTGHFVDLDEENTSVWSPSPEAYPEKHRPSGDRRHTTYDDRNSSVDPTPRDVPQPRHTHASHVNSISHVGRPPSF